MRVRRACQSLHYSPLFNGQFSYGRGLAGTRMSPFWILLQLRMLKAVVTTGDKSYAELQSNRRHQQTNSEHFTGWMPFLSANEQCQSEHWKEWSLCFHRKKSIRLFFFNIFVIDCNGLHFVMHQIFCELNCTNFISFTWPFFSLYISATADPLSILYIYRVWLFAFMASLVWHEAVLVTHKWHCRPSRALCGVCMCYTAVVGRRTCCIQRTARSFSSAHHRRGTTTRGDAVSAGSSAESWTGKTKSVAKRSQETSQSGGKEEEIVSNGLNCH